MMAALWLVITLVGDQALVQLLALCYYIHGGVWLLANLIPGRTNTISLP